MPWALVRGWNIFHDLIDMLATASPRSFSALLASYCSTHNGELFLFLDSGRVNELFRVFQPRRIAAFQLHDVESCAA